MDIRYPDKFRPGIDGDEFLHKDLRYNNHALQACLNADWIFALAADMGGIGFITTEQTDIMRDNTLIDVNTIEAAKRAGVERLLYASSACVYPDSRQTRMLPPKLAEFDVYPAEPGTAYGWEKLHAEHLCHFYRAAGWVDCCVSRMHTIYGPGDPWRGGREKVIPALCRKVAIARLTGDPHIEIWGDGEQVRSFTYIDDCVEGMIRQMEANAAGPLNLGHERTVTIDQLADIIADVAGARIEKVHVPGVEGVRVRSSDNTLIREVLGWEPTITLEEGLLPTYAWIEEQVRAALAKGELL